MPLDKTTLITNIYNEEYLLPFWLNHHKNLFDHGIVIDYGSTDRSLELCKEICPTWEVRKSRNPDFGAINADIELMDLENSQDGIKMILTTTEFLFCEKPIKEVFKNYESSNISFGIKPYAPFTKKSGMYPTNLKELLNDSLTDEVLYVNLEPNRGTRQIHNYPNGNYTVGRHTTRNPSSSTNDLHLLWLGSFPFNEHIMKRKLQVKTHIPESDRKRGFSYHHFYDEQKMLDIIDHHYNNGKKLNELNPPLYNIIKNYNE
jgi:hypothetical protein